MLRVRSFTVIPRTSSFPARHEAYGKTTENLVFSWERGVNFINVLRTRFLHKILAPQITNLKHNQGKLCDLHSYEKGACKTLMKLMAARLKIQPLKFHLVCQFSDFATLKIRGFCPFPSLENLSCVSIKKLVRS